MQLLINSRFDPVTRILSVAIPDFYHSLEIVFKYFNFEEMYKRFSEKSYSDLIDKALWKYFSREELVSFQQIWVKKIDTKDGIPDLLVIFKNEILVLFEFKMWGYATEDEPEKYWGEVETEIYYNSILDQGREYLTGETLLKDRFFEIYICAFVFSPVKFQNSQLIEKWFLDKLLQNEFYGFNNYKNEHEEFGFAVYGKIEKFK